MPTCYYCGKEISLDECYTWLGGNNTCPKCTNEHGDEFVWDDTLSAHVKRPAEMQAFLDDIVAVYRKHNLAIGHEDTHGAFQIHMYDDEFAEWLRAAMKCY